MRTPHTVLAFDLGASSGRAMLATISDAGIELKEAHRFENTPVMMGDTLYWDMPRLMYEIETGLVKAYALAPYESVGVDTWGVDFGLLGPDGKLLENPVHYRDARTDGMPQRVFELLPRDELYARTGIQVMPLNTIFQLYSLKTNRPHMLESAQTLLFMPALISYFLTGEKQTEKTMASTSQLINAHTGCWDEQSMAALGLPVRLMPPLCEPGDLYGLLDGALCQRLRIPRVPVRHVGSHDTASAVAAVPAAARGEFMFLSCGTWSLLGAETNAPIINPQSAKCNFTNEGGLKGTTRFLKNIMGLWIIQELRRELQREDASLSFARLAEEAEAAPSSGGLIDPDDPVFAAPGDMRARIEGALTRRGEAIPQTRGALARCVYESLAAKYASTVQTLEELTGKRYDRLLAVGGGVKAELLMRMTADALGRPVQAGPIEATALGNALSQWIALGALPSVQAGRDLLRQMPDNRVYLPRA